MVKTKSVVSLIIIGGVFFFTTPSAVEKSISPHVTETIQIRNDKECDNYSRTDQTHIVDIAYIPQYVISSFPAQCLFHDRILEQQLAKEGWSICIHPCQLGVEMLPYTDGRLEMMFDCDLTTITAMSHSAMSIVALARQGYDVLIADNLRVPEELKGKRIAYIPNISHHYALFQALSVVNLSFHDIIALPMKPSDLEPALQNHRLDAVVTVETHTQRTLSGMPAGRIVFRSEALGYIGCDMNFAKRNPRIQKALVAAVYRAYSWAKQDDEHILSALKWCYQATVDFGGIPDIKPTDVWVKIFTAETINNPSFPMLPLDLTKQQGVLFKQFNFLKTIKTISSETSFDTLKAHVNYSLLPEVIQERKVWQLDTFSYSPAQVFP